MNTLTPEWIAQFDQHMNELFAIDHTDAGMDESDLRLYSDLSPKDAALAFGDDYDLDRVGPFAR